MASHGAISQYTNLRGLDKEYIDSLKRMDNKPKTIYAVYPCIVDSRNMYYKQEWMTERRFIELRNRYGKECKLLKIRKAV